MALYAFDGTGNEDDVNETAGVSKDTNVRNFCEAYDGTVEYLAGVGTRYGVLGRFFGGIFGAGGKTRIEEMYEKLQKNWGDGDKTIDITGFSRGAALAVHFANVIEKKGVIENGETVYPEIRFLGVWDIVGSFGVPRDIVFKFQDLNIGYDLTLADKVQHCFHAMSMHERRDCFKVTRLNRPGGIARANETWFRGVHSDVGGGIRNIGLSSISLSWMFQNAQECGLGLKPDHVDKAKDNHNIMAPLSHNADIIIGHQRRIRSDDTVHDSAIGRELAVGEEHTFTVDSKILFNWSGVRFERGASYMFTPEEGKKWKDASIECDTRGWKTEELSWLKENIVEHFEDNRRFPDADWFELIGAIGDDDKKLFRIGAGGKSNTYQAIESGEFYAFANDLVSKYDNNEGCIDVTIKRIS